MKKEIATRYRLNTRISSLPMSTPAWIFHMHSNQNSFLSCQLVQCQWHRPLRQYYVQYADYWAINRRARRMKQIALLLSILKIKFKIDICQTANELWVSSMLPPLILEKIHRLHYLATYNMHPKSPPPQFITPMASAARFCCIACCSANLNPTLCVILTYRAAQFSTQFISCLSRDLERKEETQDLKHFSTRSLYMLCLATTKRREFYTLKRNNMMAVSLFSFNELDSFE